MSEEAKGLDKRVSWLRKKVEIAFAKIGDKKFEKLFLAEEVVAKVRVVIFENKIEIDCSLSPALIALLLVRRVL
jgi:hypothetical protein